MKKIILPLLLVFIIALGGCNSSLQIGAVEKSTKHEFSSSYYKLNGTKEKRITVKEGNPLKVSMEVVTNKGSIDVTISMDKDNVDYEGHDIPTTSSAITLSKPGNYTIKVNAKDHKGGYQFKW